MSIEGLQQQGQNVIERNFDEIAVAAAAFYVAGVSFWLNTLQLVEHSLEHSKKARRKQKREEFYQWTLCKHRKKDIGALIVGIKMKREESHAIQPCKKLKVVF